MAQRETAREDAGDRHAWWDNSDLAAVVFLERGTWYLWRNQKWAPDDSPQRATVERWQDRRVDQQVPWAPLWGWQVPLLRKPIP